MPDDIIPITDIERRELAKLVPEDRFQALLSGLGFYKMNQQRRRQLRYALVGSSAGFVLALAALGSYVVMHARQEPPTAFQKAPPARTYAPREVENKVRLKKRQRASSRPSMLPRVAALKLTDLAVPELKVDPKRILSTFQPKFMAVTGTGLGAGPGKGYGETGFDDGVSQIDLIGVHAKGEKIAILLDVSVSMVETEKGGPEGFARVRQRCEEVVDSLSEGTLFNVFVFADAASQFEKQMAIASRDNKTRAKLWLRPFNSPGNYGLDQGNVSTGGAGLQAFGGTTRLDLALTAACRQGADTIMVLTDGLPKVKKGWTAEQMAAFNNQRAAWGAANAGAIAAWDAGAAAAPPAQAERVWVPPTPARPPSKAALREGSKPDPGSPAIPGHWAVITHGGNRGGAARPAAPPIPDPGFWTLTDFAEHLRLLYEAHGAKLGLKPPVVNCIGYMIDNEGNAFLQGLARNCKGEYRRVAELR